MGSRRRRARWRGPDRGRLRSWAPPAVPSPRDSSSTRLELGLRGPEVERRQSLRTHSPARGENGLAELAHRGGGGKALGGRRDAHLVAETREPRAAGLDAVA